MREGGANTKCQRAVMGTKVIDGQPISPQVGVPRGERRVEEKRVTGGEGGGVPREGQWSNKSQEGWRQGR